MHVRVCEKERHREREDVRELQIGKESRVSAGELENSRKHSRETILRLSTSPAAGVHYVQRPVPCHWLRAKWLKTWEREAILSLSLSFVCARARGPPSTSLSVFLFHGRALSAFLSAANPLFSASAMPATANARRDLPLLEYFICSRGQKPGKNRAIARSGWRWNSDRKFHRAQLEYFSVVPRSKYFWQLYLASRRVTSIPFEQLKKSPRRQRRADERTREYVALALWNLLLIYERFTCRDRRKKEIFIASRLLLNGQIFALLFI